MAASSSSFRIRRPAAQPKQAGGRGLSLVLATSTEARATPWLAGHCGRSETRNLTRSGIFRAQSSPEKHEDRRKPARFILNELLIGAPARPSRAGAYVGLIRGGMALSFGRGLDFLARQEQINTVNFS